MQLMWKVSANLHTKECDLEPYFDQQNGITSTYIFSYEMDECDARFLMTNLA